ncbi:MAG: TonB-dependent receptor plug domain-containing protein [Lewinellaceae bacterium]|nr:TonB-dependent receptor plug domain-containing protein [Lewinellaceae bacterium]
MVLSLFVVNGQILGGGRRAASNFVPVNDIQSIRVLKNPSETGIYGVQGANGVIEIQLKKTEPVTTVTTSIPVFSEI